MKSVAKKTYKSVILGSFTPVICSIIFMILAATNLTSSIWFDEAYSSYLSRGSFVDIVVSTANDVHPPFYYFCLKIWSMIFGDSVISMRFLSIFFGAITIILLYQLLKRWFGVKVSSFATLLASISPMFVRYGQEMRMYTLVFLIVVAATYALDLAMTEGKKRHYVAYAILISLGMWTHYFAALAWLAHIVYYKLILKRKIFEKRMIKTYLLAVGLFLPWLPVAVYQFTTVQANGFWIPEVTANTPVDFISNALIFKQSEETTGWLALLVYVALIIAIVLAAKVMSKNPKASDKLGLLFCLITVPPILLVIASMPPLSSVFIHRYIMYTAALLWVLTGVIIGFACGKGQEHKARTRTCAGCLAVILFICSVVGNINVYNREPLGYVKDIYEMVDLVSENGEPVVASNPWLNFDLAVYSNDRTPIYGVDEWNDYFYGSTKAIRQIRYNLIENFDEFVKGNETFWFVIEKSDNIQSIDDIDPPHGDLRIISEVSSEHHIAVQLEKK